MPRVWNIELVRTSRAVRFLQFFVCFAAVLLIGTIAHTQQRASRIPISSSNSTDGKRISLQDGDLCNFELELCDQFSRLDAPDEIFTLGFGRPYDIRKPESGRHVGFLTISTRGTNAELRSYAADAPERHYFRRIREAELAKIQSFVRESRADDLPELSSARQSSDGTVSEIVGGVQYVYLHLNAKGGRRVLINNPPVDEHDAPPGDERWQYRKLTEFFEKLDDENDKLELRYTLSRPVRGLKTIYAPRVSDVINVWKDKDTLCVSLRNKWGREIVIEHRALRDGGPAEEVNDPKLQVVKSWEVEGLPLRYPRESSDGRFVAGNRRDNGEFQCFDRREKKWVSAASASRLAACYPLYYLDSHSVFVLGQLNIGRILDTRGGYERHEWEDLTAFDPRTEILCGIDKLPGIESPSLQPPSFWFQSLPHRMQRVDGSPHTVWAAMVEDNGMEVGHYDTKRLVWSRVTYIPNLKFETKDMYIDESNNLIYFVFKGHLLSVPMPTSKAG